MIDYKLLDEQLSKEIRTKKIIDLVGTGKRVLDLGAYSGYIAKEVEKNGNEVIAVDSNQEFVEYCRGRGLNCVYAHCETKFPFEDGIFDTVIAGEIIEHVYDTNQFLNECNRVLKMGGEVVLTTPNLGFWKHRIKLLLGLNMPFEYGMGGYFVNHIRYFNLASLKRALKGHGFAIVRTEPSYYFYDNSFLNIFIPNIFKNFSFHIIAVLKKVK